MRKRLDNVVVSHTVQKLNEANLDLAFLQRVEFEAFYERGTTDQTVSPNERVLAIQKSQSGLRTGRRRSSLRFKSRATCSQQTKQLLIGFCDNFLVHTCFSLKPSKSDDTKGGAPENSAGQDSAARREFVISLLDQRLRSLEWLNGLARKNQQLELDTQARSLALPNEGATDTILRYETHLDRQLYRAMDQLERMQWQRKGDHVPPPLNVNLGRRG